MLLQAFGLGNQLASKNAVVTQALLITIKLFKHLSYFKNSSFSFFLSVCMSSFSLSVFWFVCLPTYLSVSVCLPSCLSVCLPSCLSVCLPSCLSVCLSVFNLYYYHCYYYLFIYLFIFPTH